MSIKYIGKVLHSVNTSKTDLQLSAANTMYNMVIRTLKKEGITFIPKTQPGSYLGFKLEKDGEVSEYDLVGNIIVDVELEDELYSLLDNDDVF